MAKLKVWGMSQIRGRAVIAAHSQVEAAKALGCSIYALRKWAAITGNKREVEAALAEPGKVIIFPAT